MTKAAIPNDTTAEILEDGEMFQIGAPQMSLAHRFSSRGLDVHFCSLPLGGAPTPAVLIRSKDSGRAVAFPIYRLADAAVAMLAKDSGGRIIV